MVRAQVGTVRHCLALQRGGPPAGGHDAGLGREDRGDVVGHQRALGEGGPAAAHLGAVEPLVRHAGRLQTAGVGRVVDRGVDREQVDAARDGDDLGAVVGLDGAPCVVRAGGQRARTRGCGTSGG